MRRKGIRSIVTIVLLLLLLVGCSGSKRKPTVQKNAVRIYDVVSQDKSEFWSDIDPATLNDGDETKAEKIAAKEKIDNTVFYRHPVRIGMFTSIGDDNKEAVPYYDQIQLVSEATGVDIEYVVYDNWEQMRQALKEHEDDGMTKIVLFNNSYDQSLIKEMQTGRYMDLGDALAEIGLYDEEAYQQAVLEAGVVGGQQVMVPLLYNVSGIVQGQWHIPGEEAPEGVFEENELEYQELIAALIEEMKKDPAKVRELPFMTASMLDGTQPSTFLSAAGIRWDSYASQESLFNLLYEYFKTYEETQVKTGTSQQNMWIKYLNDYEWAEQSDQVDADTIEVLNLFADKKGTLAAGKMEYGLAQMISQNLLMKTQYFVECSMAESVPYHSVFGSLSYRNFYQAGVGIDDQFQRIGGGEMAYWPVALMNEAGGYAAQPISYAAVYTGGDTELAAKVIKGITEQYVAPYYGISVNNKVRTDQLDLWVQVTDADGGKRSIETKVEGEAGLEMIVESASYWKNECSGGIVYDDDKTQYLNELETQLNNISIAQIPDREILSIWQETVAESVTTGLSAEAGFELLCERMDEWYQ